MKTNLQALLVRRSIHQASFTSPPHRTAPTLHDRFIRRPHHLSRLLIRLITLDETMVFTYSEEALKIAIAQLAQNVGWHGIGSNSFEILIDLCARFMKEIGKTSTCIANQYNRTQVNYNDLQLAFNYLGISVSELEDYYTHVESIPFVKGNPARYPVKSTKGPKRINYPDQSELKARSEFYEEWMPSIRMETEDSGLLNSKIGKDSDLNEDSLLNGVELSEEEMDKRYLNSMRKQVGPSEKIDGYTELEALLPNYIYLSVDGRALSYGGNEGKLPECRPPPLTADDLERMQQEEERRQQELQREKEKAFQPLKLKINNKDKLKFKKYLTKGLKSSNDYISKELLKRAKKDKKLKPRMNLNKFSIKMYNANKASEAERNSLKQKQDLLETAEKLGLSSEIDEIKKFSRLKERTMKEKKIKVLKEEDLEKQRRKRERMRKKQEELERKQRLREERRMRKEAREREKEEKRKARELKRLEKERAKQERARKPRATKKTKAAQSKAEMDDTNSNLSLNSSMTNTSTLKNTSTNSNLNEYDEKEAANILVSLSEDKKSGRKSTKRQNKPISSPLISSSSDEDSSDEDDNSSTSSVSPAKDAKKKKEEVKAKKTSPKKLDLKKNSDPAAPPKPPFKSLAERKAMPPTILESNKPKAAEPVKKAEKPKKRKNESKDNGEINDLFKPTFTLPTIKKKLVEKKPKKKFNDDYIESSSSSSSSEDERALISKKKKDDKKKKLKKESLPKLTVKLPSRTNSPLPGSSISPKSSKKDKLGKKDEKKSSKKELVPEKKGKKDETFKESSKKTDKPGAGGKLNQLSSPKPDENRPKKKAKVIITPTKAARKEAQEKSSCVLVTQTVSTNDAEKEYYCPSCSKPDDGSPMLGECSTNQTFLFCNLNLVNSHDD